MNDTDAAFAIYIHRDPTAAQKAIDDANPPGPWPWWLSGTFTGGPYETKALAIEAAITKMRES